jgi:hypothetical protein
MMDSTCLVILTILTIIGIFLMCCWFIGQVKAKHRIKIMIGACGILLLLFFLLNLFVLSAKLSSCFLYFTNQYIATTSVEDRIQLIDEFFPESYTETEREKVRVDFDRYLITKPIPVAKVAQVFTTPVGPVIVRFDADGNIIEPHVNISYGVRLDLFVKNKYKIVQYSFR